ncbi:hypothetical protein RchiOBHm_Chr3g0461641 [Rosa chinensis]|uniref:Uncharacterized protein n=1 Tax=Rosa chinensis TaxID=74649 RepID=A0A2P6R8P6_ROSCH|nr:hypothetical protein RchiOBHm_Chr3g0461641 [Rosa chinensis]
MPWCTGTVFSEKLGGDDDDNDELLERLQTYSSFGEVSFLCNIPQPYAVRVWSTM